MRTYPRTNVGSNHDLVLMNPKQKLRMKTYPKFTRLRSWDPKATVGGILNLKMENQSFLCLHQLSLRSRVKPYAWASNEVSYFVSTRWQTDLLSSSSRWLFKIKSPNCLLLFFLSNFSVVTIISVHLELDLSLLFDFGGAPLLAVRGKVRLALFEK